MQEISYLHSCTLRGAWIEIYIVQVKLARPAPTPQKVNWGGASFTLRHEFLAVLSLSFSSSSFPIVSVSDWLGVEEGERNNFTIFTLFFINHTRRLTPASCHQNTGSWRSANLAILELDSGKEIAVKPSDIKALEE